MYAISIKKSHKLWLKLLIFSLIQLIIYSFYSKNAIFSSKYLVKINNFDIYILIYRETYI